MISIDDMIKSGKTLPEIQSELRKIVAARDEAALEEEKRKYAAAAAKEKVATAMKEWFSFIGIPIESEADQKMFNNMIDTIEAGLIAAVKGPSSKATEDFKILRELIDLI